MENERGKRLCLSFVLDGVARTRYYRRYVIRPRWNQLFHLVRIFFSFLIFYRRYDYGKSSRIFSGSIEQATNHPGFFFYSIASGCYGEFPQGESPRKLGRQLWVNENACFSLLLYSVLSPTFLCRCTGSFAKIIKSLLLGKYTQERLVREFCLYECNYSLVPSTLGDWCNVNFVISTTS